MEVIDRGFQRALVPTAAAALAASSLLYPPLTLHAEAPIEQTVCP